MSSLRWFHRLAIGIFVSLTVLTYPAFPRPKTDIVVMTNGDRLTCEVKNLVNGVLQIELDYVDGTVAVDWRRVARVESKALFLIQVQDGSVYSGTVITPDALPGAPVTLEIRPGDRESRVVDRSQVVRMTQFSKSFLRRLSGNLSLGTVYSKGNNATQYTFGSELDYQQTRWGARLSYDSNLSSSSGASAATRNQVELAAYRLLPWNNYFYAGTASLLQSSAQQIHEQTILGLGAGRFLKNNTRVRLTLMGGLGWQRTNYLASSDPQHLQNVAVGLIGWNLEAFNFKKTRLTIHAYAFPALTQAGRVFSRINATYYLKLFGKVDWNLSAYGNWDTKPPPERPSSDYGTSTGLSWTFGNK